jgi:A/G-specific adenine glycosylase
VLALPGIGPYTAGAICSIAFNQPTPILDGNVIRVLARVFGIAGNPRDRLINRRLWEIARQLVSATKHCSSVNQSLMELGALICVPKQPKCHICPVIDQCSAHVDNRVHQLPTVVPRRRPTQRRFAAFVLERKNRFLIRQRPRGVVNAHLWEFPNVETTSKRQSAKESAQNLFKIPINRLHRILTVRHSITRYRITMEVWRVNEADANNCAPIEGRWFNLKKLISLPFASAHKRVLLTIKSQTLSNVEPAAI